MRPLVALISREQDSAARLATLTYCAAITQALLSPQSVIHSRPKIFPRERTTAHANLSGNELSASDSGDSYGIVYFLVRAPHGAVLDLHASNGEVSVHNVDGTITATTENGPVSIKASSGTITARAQNGPISFGGASSGTVKLSAQNGPITVKLDGTTFNGSLDASTSNGPLSVKVPRGYRSGVVVESDGHSPFAWRR